MAIESTEDRTAFVETFGVSVVLAGETILGIFDNPYLDVLDASSSIPQIMIVTSDAPSVAYGDTVVIASESFSGSVREIMPDGTGITTLMLGSD